MSKITRTMDRIDQQVGLSSANESLAGDKNDQISNLSDRLTRITAAVGIDPQPPAHPKKSLIPRISKMSKLSKIPRLSTAQNDSAQILNELKRKSTQLRKSIGGKQSAVFETLDEKIDEIDPMDKSRVSNLAAFVTDLGKNAGIEAPAIDQTKVQFRYPQ